MCLLQFLLLLSSQIKLFNSCDHINNPQESILYFVFNWSWSIYFGLLASSVTNIEQLISLGKEPKPLQFSDAAKDD